MQNRLLRPAASKSSVCASFKNVYLLEQGEYAEFLKKPPQRQLEAVGKIFSLMRFGDVFKLAARNSSRAFSSAAISARLDCASFTRFVVWAFNDASALVSAASLSGVTSPSAVITLIDVL